MNPSPYPRSGVVIVPWQPVHERTGLDADDVAVVDQHRFLLRSQVDRIDPADPNQDRLVIALGPPAMPGDPDYSTLSAVLRVTRDSRPALPGPTVTAERFASGIHLQNERLDLWFHFGPELDPPRRWFGGAVTSVVLDGVEMLDANAATFGWTGHNPEKRAMQVDLLRIFGTEETTLRLFDRPWRPVAFGSGPVAAWMTVACDEYHRWTVYRTLTLFAGAASVRDELWLVSPEEPPLFAPRFFMWADFSLFPEIRSHPSSGADWFAVASQFPPHQGYGFATNARAGTIANPPGDYPNPSTEHRAFSWELGPTRYAQSLHLFRLHTNGFELGDLAGRTWYDEIYKPLRAGIIGE